MEGGKEGRADAEEVPERSGPTIRADLISMGDRSVLHIGYSEDA
jgi:hypothetical protein